MDTTLAARDHPTAVFYGDSIVTGWRGTSSPRGRWTSLVSDALGWREVNLAIDGMGWLRRRGPRDATGEPATSADDTTLLDTGIRLAPSAFVGCLGANDLRFLPDREADVRRSMQRDLGLLRDSLPATPVVWTMYLPVALLSARAQALEGWLIETCAACDVSYVPEFVRCIAGRDELLCPDRIHPNDAGHRALADAVLPTLRSVAPGRVT